MENLGKISCRYQADITQRLMGPPLCVICANNPTKTTWNPGARTPDIQLGLNGHIEYVPDPRTAVWTDRSCPQYSTYDTLICVQQLTRHARRLGFPDTACVQKMKPGAFFGNTVETCVIL